MPYIVKMIGQTQSIERPTVCGLEHYTSETTPEDAYHLNARVVTRSQLCGNQLDARHSRRKTISGHVGNTE